MKLLLDMNLSPQWCGVLRTHGHECLHWASVGDVRADDARILNWALANDHIVITHDLDFGAILAATGSAAPSVVLLRWQDILPSALEDTLLRALEQHADVLKAGALIVLDETRAKIRPGTVTNFPEEIGDCPRKSITQCAVSPEAAEVP